MAKTELKGGKKKNRLNATLALTGFIVYVRRVFTYLKSLFAKGVRSTLDHSEKIKFLFISPILQYFYAVQICPDILPYHVNVELSIKKNLPVFIFFK